MTSSKPQSRFDIISILKVLKPLLFLLIPLVIYIINHMLVIDHYPEVAVWVDYVVWGMCAIVGIWVLIRIIKYIKGIVYLWRHDREEMRKDPLFVIETKMRGRLKEVHDKLRRIDRRPYDIPFYAVIAPQNRDVETLLEGSGVVFPKDLNRAIKKSNLDDYERWHIGNEAVFADVTSLQNPAKEQEWRLFLKTLAGIRSAAPINGVVVVVPFEQIKGKGSRSNKEMEAALQKNLQFIQERLLEKFPVYLLISNVDKMSGFNEFFGDLSDKAKGQIIGWSGAEDFDSRRHLDSITKDIAKAKVTIEQIMLQKMADQKSIRNVDKIYLFAAEFGKLLSRASDFVTRVFDPDAYLEPVPFRGFYLVGGASLSPGASQMLSSASVPMDGQTVIGEGAAMKMDAATMIGEGVNIEAMKNTSNWFTRDFFLKKLIPEWGNIARPRWVLKRQRLIKTTAIFAVVFQFLLLGYLLYDEYNKSGDWLGEAEEVIKRAHFVLGKPVYDKQDDLLAQKILEDIIRIQDILKKEGLFKGATSIGYNSKLADNLTNLHSLVYQKYFLAPLIKKVEAEISGWDGIEKPFVPFGQKLIEYVRWANPKYTGELKIIPFLSKGTDAVTTKHRSFMLRHFLQKQSGAIPRMTDNNAVARISKALERVNGNTRITLPLETGPKARLAGESEWEWWARLTQKTEGFTGTIQKLIMIKSPFTEEAGGRDPNDQIYHATKVVEQLMASVLEMEGLMDEGRKKFPTWISSLPDFFPDMKSAAEQWPPILEAIDKCEQRSDHAYEIAVTPILKKEMAWIQTFMGLKADTLTALLDGVIQKKMPMLPMQIQIYRENGRAYLSFLKSFNGYLLGFGELIKKSGALVSASTYYTGDQLIEKLEAVKKEIEALTKLETNVVATAGVLDNVMKDVDEGDANDPELKAKDGLKKNAKKLGKDALKDAANGVQLKRDVLRKFQWREISAWIRKWQKGLKSEKAYLASIYWMELFDWFKPFTKNQMRGGSYASILKMNLFMHNNSQALTSDIEKFLDGWILSIPGEIKAILAEEDAARREPSLKDFVVLYKQVEKFRSEYMPLLRQSAATFVGAVAAMESNAEDTFKHINDNTLPELNWDALEAFSKFKTEYEIKEGIGLRNITGSLEEIEIALSKTFNGELSRKFDAAWNASMRKLRAKETDTKFPFVKNGPSASFNEATNALKEMLDLGIALGVIKAEDGTAVEMTGESKKILDRIIPTVRRTFLQKCAAYHKFMVGEGEQMPEVTVQLKSGDIGKHYHWVRMFVGRLRYFDLSVYGNKTADIDLASMLGGVKFMGLDVEKSALAEQTVTKGELGLLQIAYLNGRALDKEKSKWRITSSLASASADGEQVSFDLEFLFSKPLPPLPIIPGR